MKRMKKKPSQCYEIKSKTLSKRVEKKEVLSLFLILGSNESNHHHSTALHWILDSNVLFLMFNRNDRSCSFGAEPKYFLSIHTSISLIRTLCSHSEHANVVACDLDYELYVYRDRPTESKAKSPIEPRQSNDKMNESVCQCVFACIMLVYSTHSVYVRSQTIESSRRTFVSSLTLFASFVRS